MVDHCTGFCAAAIIENKSAEAAVDGLWRAWYKAGYPVIRNVLSDNGKEFVGSSFLKLLERFETRHLTVAPFHPASNGKCKRIHYIVDQNMPL